MSSDHSDGETPRPHKLRRLLNEDGDIVTVTMGSASGSQSSTWTEPASQSQPGPSVRTYDTDDGPIEIEEGMPIPSALKGKGKAPVSHSCSTHIVSGLTTPPQIEVVPDDIEEVPAPPPPEPPTKKPSPPRSDTPPASEFNCPICFCPPTAAVLTLCGHVMCGSCLFASVDSAAIRNRGMGYGGEALIAKCPVCRATLEGWDGRGGGVIGMELKTTKALRR